MERRPTDIAGESEVADKLRALDMKADALLAKLRSLLAAIPTPETDTPGGGGLAATIRGRIGELQALLAELEGR